MNHFFEYFDLQIIFNLGFITSFVSLDLVGKDLCFFLFLDVLGSALVEENQDPQWYTACIIFKTKELGRSIIVDDSFVSEWNGKNHHLCRYYI